MPRELWNRADVVIRSNNLFNEKTGKHEAEMIRSGVATLITFLHPAAPDNHEMIKKLRDRNIGLFTMDGIPAYRTHNVWTLTSMSTITVAEPC